MSDFYARGAGASERGWQGSRYAVGAAGGGATRVRLGRVTIDLPALPTFNPPQLPSVAAYQDVLAKVTSGGASGIASAVAAAAALAPPPYGTAIAVGMQALSFVGGLFGDSSTPPPNVKGVSRGDLTENALANPNIAALAGRIIGGQVEVEGALRESIAFSAKTGVLAALRRLADGETVVAVDRALREFPVGRRTSFRAVAYFVAYAGYDTIFNSDFAGGQGQAAQVGRVLAWAAPRIQLRELLMYAYAARMLEVVPHAETNLIHPLARRSEFFYEVTESPAGWWNLAMARAVPAPDRDETTGLWTYAPIPAAILQSEIPLYEGSSYGAATLPILDTVTANDVHPFWMPDVGWTFAEAVAQTYARARADKEYMNVVEDLLDQARKGAVDAFAAKRRVWQGFARAASERARRASAELLARQRKANPAQRVPDFSRFAKAAKKAKAPAPAKTAAALAVGVPVAIWALKALL